VGNTTAGKTGVWLYQIGERQEYDNFEVSRAQFAPKRKVDRLISSDEFRAPRLPSPQDWVLVLERVKP